MSPKAQASARRASDPVDSPGVGTADASSRHAFALERWAATSGNTRLSRANLAIRGGGRVWRAHSTGNGPVDALLRAVDIALAPFLGDGVELQSYNVHATGEGHDTAGVVTISLRTRSDDLHAPAYPGRGVHENILEASLLAYVDAINRLMLHGNVDVDAAAPQLDSSEPASRVDDDESRKGEALLDLYNR
jgi:hypothetical protein